MNISIKNFQLINILFFSIIICSCSSEIREIKNEYTSVKFDTSLKSGLVNLKVLCKTDTNITYALYLPEKYNTKAGFPLIIFFDSHAKGSLPVEKYKSLADKFGFIIAGSNNSKNGLSSETTNFIGLTIKKDLLQRFSVDENRIYAGGFSGGARVAGAIASVDSSFKGIIGCSAGFNLSNIKQKTFNFIGIAGINDMNYNELVILNKTLEKSYFQHILLTFDGKHDWAPAEAMQDAFLWIHLNDVKSKNAERNENVIKDFELRNIAAAKEAIAEKKNIKALDIYRKLVTFFNGISETSYYQKEISMLENLSDVKNSLIEKEKSEIKEQALQKAYLEELQKKDIAWWKTESVKLNNRINKAVNSYEKAMFNRVSGFLSLAAFSYVNRAIQMNDFKMAEHFNEIYLIVDPLIPDQRFFAACIYAEKGDAKNVILSLHDAVKLGLTDIDRIKENEMLKPFVSPKELDKIIEEIKQGEKEK